MFNIIFSIFVCAAASSFFAWVAHVSAKYGSTHELYTCLFMHVSILPLKMSLGECCPSCCDSSLNLIVLVFVFGTESTSVPGRCSLLGVIDIYLCVDFHHHLCLRLVHHQ